MDGVDGRAAAALAGSLVEPAGAHRGRRGTSVAGLRAAPRRAGLDPRGAVPDDLVLIAVVGPDANVGLARLEMLDVASRLT